MRSCGSGDREDEIEHPGGTKMRIELSRLWRDEDGATALEYGLMAAAVAGVLIVAAYFLGGRVKNQLNNVAQHI
jgi:pilus assembly protein Flp/PilA